MKKSFSIGKQNRSVRNSRGVAIVFTLGILGLLTVIALGFASTALLNRKIADNTGDMIYARHIAKNIALAHASYSVSMNFPAADIYSKEISGDPAEKDFLWKMDTILDGVKLYWSTGEADTTYRDDAARWQYLYGPDNDPASGRKRILGRFAYAAVSFSGRMDPMVNLGTESDRYGATEKELKLPSNGYDWNTNLNGKLSLPSRWASPVEIFKALRITDTATKKNFLSSGIGFESQSVPEVYWVDRNNDGKKTDDELYLRCNFPYYRASDADAFWKDMTVEKLIGESETDKTLEDAKASGEKSVSFIPWLKHMAADRKTQAQQIAANILQYNRPGPDDPNYETVTDKDSNSKGKDWLTTQPVYAGIGRHPMLNEIGFKVSIKAEVKKESAGKDSSGTPQYIYTPKYTVTVGSGAELVDPFFSPKHNYASVRFSGNIKITLAKLKDPGANSEVSAIEDGTFELNTKNKSESIGGWDIEQKDLDNIFDDDSNKSEDKPKSWGDNNYTTADKFWTLCKKTIKPVEFTSSNDWDPKEILKRMKIGELTFDPQNVVMYYSTGKDPINVDNNGIPYQRDYTTGLQLHKVDPKDEFDIAKNCKTDPEDPDKVISQEWVYYIAYEAKDPLNNAQGAIWKKSTSKEWVDDTDAKYPGSIAEVNSTIAEQLEDDSALDEQTKKELEAFKAGKRLSTSYIRHAPMRSLWELGCISRGEAWKSLNLSKSKSFDVSATTDAAKLIPGTFEEGDANILDQIKFRDTDELYVYGKVNINAPYDIHAPYHKIMEQVFKTDVTWRKDLTVGNAEEPFGTTGISGNDSLVCANTDGKCLEPCSDPGSCGKNCLAHLLMERSRILPFSSRTDILLDPADADFEKIPGYEALSSTKRDNLKHIQGKLRDLLLKPLTDSTDIKLEREQYAARFMNLLDADPLPEDHVYIIIVAQVIRDVGGAPKLVDWNKNGEFDSSAVNITAEAKYLSTGYVRKKLDGSGYELIGAPASFKELDNTLSQIGTYEPGVDKITGETKLIVEMVRDRKTMKWKTTRFRYVE